MYCEHCGKPLDDKAVICVNCGTATNYLPPAASVNKSNSCAVAGFILSFFGIMGSVFSVIGLVLSIVGLNDFKAKQQGKGLAIAGIVISICAFILHCLIMVLLLPIIKKAVGTLFIVFFLLLIL